jgi:DNA-binding response OmpR family regulator
METFRIMLIEDDEKIRSLVADLLSRWGWEVSTPDPTADFVAEAVRLRPHLIVLDVGLPRLDGFEWCGRLREATKAPILFLSARSQSSDIARGLAAGGDDWLVKPFDAEVLVAKIRALLRRAYVWAPDTGAHLERNGLLLDRERNAASFGGASVQLTRNETLLLARLMEVDGRVTSRGELMDALWSEDVFVDDNTLTVNVSRLRDSLERMGARGLIETVRGGGYRVP